MAEHGVLASDPRLPVEVLERKNLRQAEGRILVHGEEESSGRPYLLLENIEGKIQFLYHNNEIQQARRQGLLQPNSYAVLHSDFIERQPRLTVTDLGDAELILINSDFFRDRHGPAPGSHIAWQGWLGRFHAASANNREPGPEPARTSPRR